MVGGGPSIVGPDGRAFPTAQAQPPVNMGISLLPDGRAIVVQFSSKLDQLVLSPEMTLTFVHRLFSVALQAMELRTRLAEDPEFAAQWQRQVEEQAAKAEAAAAATQQQTAEPPVQPN